MCGSTDSTLGHIDVRVDSYTRREYNAMIDVALGGRAAEEMIYGREDVTSGCSSDLQRATDVAARMIRVCGLVIFVKRDVAEH